MVDNGFHGNSLPTVGVELELQLVDAGTLALRGGIEGLFAELPSALAGSVRREFHASCVEIASDVCKDVDEIRRDLKAKLRWVAGAAATTWDAARLGGHAPLLALEGPGSHRRSRGIAPWRTCTRRRSCASSPSASTSTWASSPATRRSGRATGFATTCPSCLPSRPTARSGAAGPRGSCHTGSRSWAACRREASPRTWATGPRSLPCGPPDRLRPDRVAQGPLVGRPSQPGARDGRGPDLRHAPGARSGPRLDGLDPVSGLCPLAGARAGDRGLGRSAIPGRDQLPPDDPPAEPSGWPPGTAWTPCSPIPHTRRKAPAPCARPRIDRSPAPGRPRRRLCRSASRGSG